MPNASPNDITSTILKKLGVTMPGFSFEIGSPERKIIEAVAESIFESTSDSLIIETNFDIDTKSGVELDSLLSIFGFGRLQGRKATGELRFSLSYPATQPVYIAQGTQAFVYSNIVGEQALVFSTSTVGFIDVGQTEVYVAAECTTAGTRGNASSSIITGLTAGSGVTSVINPLPFAGGTDPETDDQLRQRFKQTFLRNIAGTEDFYRALCLQMDSVSKVNVLGPIERHYEQLQMGTTTTPVPSQAVNVKYVWPLSAFLISDPDSPTEHYYTPTVDFNFDMSTIPPKVVPVSSALQQSNVVDLEYEYCSVFSRNDPANNVTNKVDVYHNGSQPIEVQESTVTKTTLLNSTVGDKYNVANFRRWDTSATPTVGAKFQRLGSTPVLIPPSQIIAGGTTYTLGTNYAYVYDITSLRGSERELSGLVWITTAPAENLPITINYTYNRLPELLNSVLKAKKQITTDVLVHAAKYRVCKVNALIMYSQGAPVSSVDASIQIALSNYFGGLNFGDWVQFSDIEQVIHNVTGVDNCRITRSTDDAVNYGVERISNAGVSVTKYTSDFKLDDDELASFSTIAIHRKSANTFVV